MAVAVPDTARVPVLSYDEFLDEFDYSPDQHITICGPTGCGKSMLIVKTILPRSEYWTYYSTKPRDATVDLLASDAVGWTAEPEDIHPWVHKKWVIGLKNHGNPDTVVDRHRDLFGRTLNQQYHVPVFANILDEGRYICDPEYCGLRKKVAQYYFAGRSDEKSIVVATQRPRYVPVEAFDQATHLFFFNDEDLQNVLRMAEAAGGNRELFKQVIPNLEITEHEGGQFLYYNTRTKERAISKVEI